MPKRRILKLFECWQSDDIETRNFIRKALKKVATKINGNEKLQYAIEIDRDTQSIVGSVDIQKVILDKIDKCDIFVCDVSSTGINDKTGDPIINDNVAFELGYACGSKKVTGNILLANSETTDSKDLPFDIRNLRVKFFSIENDKSADNLANSILEIISQYVNEVSGVLYQEEEESLIKAIQAKNAPRSRADSVVRELYASYIDLYPKEFQANTYMSELYGALIQSAAITERTLKLIDAAIDYEQLDVIESLYNNLEIILVECSPSPTSYSPAQLEYAEIICSDIIFLILGALIDRKRWDIISVIKDIYKPIRYFDRRKTISMSDISELRAPSYLIDYIRSKDNSNYYFPISILEQDMYQDNKQILKYIVAGDLFLYLSDRKGKWYYPQTIGILSNKEYDMVPGFIHDYTSRNGFNILKNAMGYTTQASARKYVWGQVTELAKFTMSRNPLRTAFQEIGITSEDDLWKTGNPSIAGIL